MVTDLKSILFGFSRAMYSQWFFYKPDNLLFDAGEGLATYLGNNVFATERVLLSHGHIDHLSGLPVFVHARAKARGDNEKPLEIFYPEGDGQVEAMRTYLRAMTQRLRYDLHWLPLEAGAEFPVTGSTQRFVQTFPTRHAPGRLTLGYNIVEPRRRLRAEFREWNQTQIREYVQQHGREALTETYEQKLVSYCGDGLPIEAELVRGTELLIHEATLMEPEDVKHPVHSTLEGAIEAAVAAEAKCVVLTHVSSRYRAGDIDSAALKLAEALGLECPLWVQHFNRLWRVGERNA